MKKIKLYTTYQKSLCDMLTPVAAYRKLRDHFSGSLLLESADYHDRSDSKSFICLEPMAGFSATANVCFITHFDGKLEACNEVKPREMLNHFQAFMSQFEVINSDLPFETAGLFGYTSFEAVQYMEDIKLENRRSSHKLNPDLMYHLYRFVLVFDHYKNELYIVMHSNVEHDTNGIEHISDILKITHSPEFNFSIKQEESSPIDDKTFMEYVKKGVKHCHRGDVFQLVLSREFNQPYSGDDFQVYRALRSLNPSPYLFYFDYSSFRIFGSSPESQLQVLNGKAEINPIAGTIRRGSNAKEDAKKAAALQANPKEMSEHVMLVDLARNDLSKHANNIAVDTYAEIQYFSHVIHMVSKVSGELDPAVSAVEIFADTFPAGTLSGAPKYRALELIDEIENCSRNFYGGAIGFYGFNGSVNHAIIIRSVLSKSGVLTYQAGAGIVADSTPEHELKEVNNKIAAIRLAVKNACQL